MSRRGGATDQAGQRRRREAIIGIACLTGCLLIYVLRLNGAVGLFVDDAWYVLLAKSLATGEGYALLNSPSPGILPLYPPAFPFILSLAWRLSPQFPQNVWLLKSVLIVAMMGVGVVAYRYFGHYRKTSSSVGLMIALATVLSPTLVFLATSTVMSECIYTLNFLLVIVVIERGARAGAGLAGWQYVVPGAALAATAFLTRSIAVSLIAAVFVYLLRERRLKLALLFAVTTAALVGPWTIYTRLHAPTPEQRKEQGGHIMQPYAEQFWQRRAGLTDSETISWSGLPERVMNNAIDIAGRDIGHLMATVIFEALRDPFEEANKEGARAGGSGSPLFFSFLLSALVIAGYVSTARERITLAEIATPASLAVTALWPWETFRFVLPLTPFLIFYFLLGIGSIHRLLQRLRGTESVGAQWAPLAVAAALITAINLYGNVNYLSREYSSSVLDRSQWVQTFDEVEAMLKWVAREAPGTAVIATSNPPLVHLYTGYKTISSDDPAGNWGNWDRLGVRYLVSASVYAEAVDPSEHKYRTVYRSGGAGNFRVIDLGSPESRPVWGSAASP